MRPSSQKRYDLHWRRGAVGALVFLCIVCGSVLAARAVCRPRRADGLLPVDPHRVGMARERIDPNTATVASLRRLPGIGPVTARAIVAFRRRHGPGVFRSAEDLRRVPGIGPVIAERIAPYLSLPLLTRSATGPDESHAK